MEAHFEIYTVVRIDRDAKAAILYCGQCKETADEVAYMDRADETAPDKDDASKWETIISKFPRWGNVGHPMNQACCHPGCLHHVTHPCEGCGRVMGQPTRPRVNELQEALRSIIDVRKTGIAMNMPETWCVAASQMETIARRALSIKSSAKRATNYVEE